MKNDFNWTEFLIQSLNGHTTKIAAKNTQLPASLMTLNKAPKSASLPGIFRYKFEIEDIPFVVFLLENPDSNEIHGAVLNPALDNKDIWGRTPIQHLNQIEIQQNFNPEALKHPITAHERLRLQNALSELLPNC